MLPDLKRGRPSQSIAHGRWSKKVAVELECLLYEEYKEDYECFYDKVVISGLIGIFKKTCTLNILEDLQISPVVQE